MVTRISVTISSGYTISSGLVIYNFEEYTWYTLTGNNTSNSDIRGTINFPKNTDFYFMIVGGGGSGGAVSTTGPDSGRGGGGGGIFYNNVSTHTAIGDVSFSIGRGGRGRTALIASVSGPIGLGGQTTFGTLSVSGGNFGPYGTYYGYGGAAVLSGYDASNNINM